MFSVEASLTIPVDAALAFGALASIESSVRWQVGVLGVRRAPNVPGSRRRAALLVGYYALGRRHTLRARLTACAPPTRFAYRADGDAFSLIVSLDVAPAADGTVVTYRLQVAVPSEPHPTVAPVATAALYRQLARRAPRDLARLEHFLARRLRPRQAA
ncbi:MAG: SRPBCC family protein [Gemmatirosa sp.]|nr:SRPBCC family protein [Gemmatirosa sp.]